MALPRLRPLRARIMRNHTFGKQLLSLTAVMVALLLAGQAQAAFVTPARMAAVLVAKNPQLQPTVPTTIVRASCAGRGTVKLAAGKRTFGAFVCRADVKAAGRLRRGVRVYAVPKAGKPCVSTRSLAAARKQCAPPAVVFPANAILLEQLTPDGPGECAFRDKTKCPPQWAELAAKRYIQTVFRAPAGDGQFDPCEGGGLIWLCPFSRFGVGYPFTAELSGTARVEFRQRTPGVWWAVVAFPDLVCGGIPDGAVCEAPLPG